MSHGALDVERLVDAAPGPRTRSDIGGTWRNALGSVVELHLADDHAVSGTFRPASPGGRPHEAHPVSGFAEGTSFTFCVDFGDHGSVASWTGHLVDDGDEQRLETLWQLARSRDAAPGGSPAWDALLTGSNSFTRVG